MEKNKSEETTGKTMSEATGCCKPMMAPANGACPCTSLMKRHRIAMSAVIASLALLAFAIPIGAVLGTIAFFRMM